MGPLGFSVDQLMELAGLSVAQSLASEYPPASHPRVLVIAGPGNNGGDGLVAARHLHHFGYDVQVCYPKPTDKPLYSGLVTQCRALALPFISVDSLKGASLRSRYDVVLDAVFGFSFKGAARPPFDEVLQLMAPPAQPPVLVSVDVPSGWDVETGDSSGAGLAPDMLVSLTAPKMCARSFQGAHHYLGGRFVPPAIASKFSLRLPPYPLMAQCVKLNARGAAAQAAVAVAVEEAVQRKRIADMRISYEVGGLSEADMLPDPLATWDRWFKEASDNKVCEEPNAVHLATSSDAGLPSSRVVLLKGYDERGFILYTNYNSRKGRDLATNARASFSVYWEKLQRQVRVEGLVERVSEAESDAYFQSRPRGSRIGAWVSNQSAVLPGGRQELEERQAQLRGVYEDPAVPVPRPPHWGGYLIRPLAVEFWQGRQNRLHDRLLFQRPTITADWTLARLSP